MSVSSSALSLLKSAGYTTKFKWYSNLADELMTKEVEGSFQPAITNANTWGKIAFTDNIGQKLFFAMDIIDKTGFEVTTGDFLYESVLKTVYLYNKAYLGQYIIDDVSSFNVVNGSTTLTYGVDYKIDFQRGILVRIVPPDGNGSIVSTVDINWDFIDGAVYYNTEFKDNKIQLGLDGDYYTSGYWLSYPFIKNTNLEWNHTSLITFEVDDLTDITENKLIVSIFPGNTTNTNMIDGTDAIAVTTTSATVDGHYIVTISTNTLALISAYDSLRVKIEMFSSVTTHTPTVYTTGTYGLKMNLIGAKCVVTYIHNKYVVKRILDDKAKTGYVEISLQREDR